jgi:hypothetical protein
MIRCLSVVLAVVTYEIAELADRFARWVHHDTTGDDMADSDWHAWETELEGGNVISLQEKLLQQSMKRHPAGRKKRTPNV